MLREDRPTTAPLRARGARAAWRALAVVCGVVAGLAADLGALRAHDPDPVARQLIVRALLDESRVVRPEEQQPPVFGTGSAATGRFELSVLTSTGDLAMALYVDGIAPEALDASHGPNETAVHLHLGAPDERGPILFDIQHAAREFKPATDGVTDHEGGFAMIVDTVFASEQGDLDTGYDLVAFIDALRSGEAYVSVRTTTADLYRSGEIRGNVEVVPERLDLVADLDESLVVRPEDSRPPLHGTGSAATGTLHLRINTRTGWFRAALDVAGIDPATLDASHGPNATALHVRVGAPDERGAIHIDLGEYARASGGVGVTATEGGFRLITEGELTPRQGELDTGLDLGQLVDELRLERTYVDVHTTGSALFRQGEIRGNLRVVPATVEFESDLDGEQIVRPLEFQPPRFGSGSGATGAARLVVDPDTAEFEAVVEVEGIAPEDLADADGGNATSIHVHWGFPEARGPILLDLHHFARVGSEAPNGLTRTETGFRLDARGVLTRRQGEHETAFPLDTVLSFVRGGDAYIDVHTSTAEVYRSGEIRGQLEGTSPGPSRFTGVLSGDQVVRPVSFRPPLLGSGSEATGTIELALDLEEETFTVDLRVEGIDPVDVDDTQGDNRTGVLIHKGTPNVTGPVLLDIHHFARAGNGGIEAEGDGFRLSATGVLRAVQGAVDTGYTFHEVLDLLRAGEAHVVVYTDRTLLYRTAGEIRGRLESDDAEVSAWFVRGDCNGDGLVGGSVSDAVFLLLHNFQGQPGPPCVAACDVNGDGRVTGQVADAVYMLNWAFSSGPPPIGTFPDCVPLTDPADVVLGCEASGPTCP